MNQHSKPIAAALLFTALAASCSLPKNTAHRQVAPVPAQYANAADTAGSLAATPREQFFRDARLQAVIKDVLNNNPDMNIALERIRVAGAWLKMSRGALLPSVQASALAGGTRFGRYTMEGVGNFDTNLSPNIDDEQKIATRLTPDYWLGLSSSWEVDIWGKLRKLREAARQRFLASAEGANWVRSLLVAQSASLYYELVALDNETGIIAENIRLQERALEIVEGQKAGGRATELAVQQFRAQLLNTRAAAFSVKQRITEAETRLHALAGRYDGTVARDSSLLFRRHFDSSLAVGVPATLLERRADVREAQAALKATDADLAAARAAFFPSLNLSAYTALNAFKGDLLFSASSLGFQLLGGLTAPIFQRYELKSRFRIADAEQEQAFLNLQKTALNAYREVTTNLSAIANYSDMLRLKEQEVAALEQAVGTSNELYVAGYASYLEIVAAQRSKLEAELQLVNLRRDKVLAVVDLYKSLGGG